MPSDSAPLDQPSTYLVTRSAVTVNHNIFTQFASSLRYPEFWAYSSWLDIVTRYRRTRLGLFWLLAPVMLFTFITGPFYSKVMHHELSTYMVHLGMGYAVWRLMVMVLNDSIGILRSNKSFILHGNIRLTDYTLRSIAKSVFYFAFAMIGMVLVLIWSPAVPAYAILSLFVTVPIILVNLAWVGYSMSILGARSPDVGQVLNTILMVGFLFTPIIWVGSRYSADSVGGFLVRLNPAYHFLELVREPLFGRMPPNSTLAYLAVLTLAGWLLASILCRRYSRYVPIWI